MSIFYRIVRLVGGSGQNAGTRDIRNGLPYLAAERALKKLKRQNPKRTYLIRGD